MLINKRETHTPRCTPISSSIDVCWVDLVVLSLVLLVVVYVFLGAPLTERLCKMFKGSRCDTSRRLSTSISIHHTPTQRGYSMSARRQGSEEMLLGNHDKVDDALNDPFLVVQPSLNDSMLVKQGLVEETALPPPVHGAYDIQVSRGEETPSRVRPLIITGTKTAIPPLLSCATSVDTLVLSPNKGNVDEQVREAGDKRGAIVVPFPPPAYTPYSPVGQGRPGRAGSYEEV